MSNFEYAKNLTTDATITSAIGLNLDVLSALQQEMQSDCDGSSSNMLHAYSKADEKERAAMDALLIEICGWSMSSLIDIAEKEGYVEEE